MRLSHRMIPLHGTAAVERTGVNNALRRDNVARKLAKEVPNLTEGWPRPNLGCGLGASWQTIFFALALNTLQYELLSAIGTQGRPFVDLVCRSCT